MVFAAGRGERMGPLTSRCAKPALPFCGTPLLLRILRRLRDAGVREAVVNLHHRPASLEPLLAQVESEGPCPLRVVRSFEAELLGTAGGLHRVRDRFGEESFFVVNGDTLHTADLGAMAEAHFASGAEATLLADPDPDPQLRGERRLRASGGAFAGLTAPGGAGPVFGGVWLLAPSALRHLSGRPGGLARDLFPPLAAAGSARLFETRSPWFEIGTPRRYLEASRRALALGMFRGAPADGVVLGAGASAEPPELLGPGVRLGPGARVERSVIGGEVEIGDGAVVLDSVVGPGERIPHGARIEGKLVAGGREAAL